MKLERGFTLIELLAVLVIFSLISVMAYGGLSSVLKTRAQVEQSLERTAQLQKTYQRLRDDFQLLRRRTVRDGYGEQRAALIGSREPRVEFTRGGWRNPLLSPRPGLERVSYRLDKHRLLRESFRVLDQAQDSQPVGVMLLDQVKTLKLRYLNANRQWVEEWPPPTATGATADASAAPPRAVEVTLETEKEGELMFQFRLGLDPPSAGFVPGQATPPPQAAKPATGDAADPSNDDSGETP